LTGAATLETKSINKKKGNMETRIENEMAEFFDDLEGQIDRRIAKIKSNIADASKFSNWVYKAYGISGLNEACATKESCQKYSKLYEKAKTT